MDVSGHIYFSDTDCSLCHSQCNPVLQTFQVSVSGDKITVISTEKSKELPSIIKPPIFRILSQCHFLLQPSPTAFQHYKRAGIHVYMRVNIHILPLITYSKELQVRALANWGHQTAESTCISSFHVIIVQP